MKTKTVLDENANTWQTHARRLEGHPPVWGVLWSSAVARGLRVGGGRAPKGPLEDSEGPERSLSGLSCHKYVPKQLTELKWGPFRT